MKYGALTISTLLLTCSITFSTADDPRAPSNPSSAAGVDNAEVSIEEWPLFPDGWRTQQCPPSPQPKPWLMIPHGGMQKEGCERVSLQDLEIDFAGTQIVAEEMRTEMLKQLPTWTAQRRVRSQQEKADGIVTDVSQIVRNQDAVIALGKAFFWDTQVGSDGQTACASCHFKAGADGRPRSLGVARRVLRHDQPVGADAAEPSVELSDDLFVLVYHNRWHRMVNFDEVVTDMAVHGLDRLIQIAGSGRTGLQNVFDLMDKFTLTTQEQEIVSRWNQLSDFRTSNLPKSTKSELTTRIELVVYALQYLDLAKEVEPSQEDDSDTTPYTSELWKKLDAKQVGPSRKAAALKLGRMFSPFQDPDASNPTERKVASRNASNHRESNLPNAPTVINAALHDRLFHDGRANSVFNGYDHLGDEAGRDGYGKWIFRDGRWRRVLIRIPDAALASQATAPLLSVAEMSWFGRQYHHVARKLLDRKPLALQDVSLSDSHLSAYVAASGKGLTRTYKELIQQAFHPEWWSADETVPDVAECDALTGDELALTQLEANFSLFWGVALMAYQNELISDRSEFDTLMELRRQGETLYPPDITPEARQHRQSILRGFKTFQDHACADCHRAPEFAGATRATVYGPILEFEGPLDAINAETEQNEFANWLAAGQPGLDARVERMPFRPEMAPRFYDSGFYNIGVTSDDPAMPGFNPGIAGEVRMDLSNQQGALLSIVQRFGQGLVSDLLLDRTPYVTFSLARQHSDRWASVLGSFKTPTMRNVALTAPYFHNGDEVSLEMVLKHYAEAGASVDEAGSPRAEPINRFLHPAVLQIGKEPAETNVPPSLRLELIDFLNALTDDRVRQNAAPFDHPSLMIPTSAEVNSRGRTKTDDLKPASGF